MQIRVCLCVLHGERDEIIKKVINQKKGGGGRRKEEDETDRERKREKSINYSTFVLPLAPFCGQFLLRTRIKVCFRVSA